MNRRQLAQLLTPNSYAEFAVLESLPPDLHPGQPLRILSRAGRWNAPRCERRAADMTGALVAALVDARNPAIWDTMITDDFGRVWAQFNGLHQAYAYEAAVAAGERQ
jgi:hypothetical protein